MTDFLRELANIGSAGILTAPLPAEATTCTDYGPLGKELFDWLVGKNGFYAFESALHIFPLGRKTGLIDLWNWNSSELWRGTYGDLVNAYLFFGEDIFGNQFCITNEGIATFDAETGNVSRLAKTLCEWAKLILREYEFHTGYRLAHEWQRKNRGLEAGERLLPKVPFVAGGDYVVQNLAAIDCVKGMRFRGELATQIRNLPDGTPVSFRFV